MVPKPSHITIIIVSLLLFSTTFDFAAAGGGHSHGKETKECKCIREEKDEHEGHAHEEEVIDKRVLKYKVGAIFAILGAGGAGVFLPILGKNVAALRPERGAFFLVKAFAAGVILCTAFIHILPEAFENLTNPCLGENSTIGSFPFTGLFAMLGALVTLLMDSLATRHFRKGDDEAKDVHHHVHGSGSHVPEGLDKVDLIRYRVTSQVLEMGIAVHSVIIGITVGTAESLDVIKPLMIALCFHQFFEGVGLGGCLVQAAFKSVSTLFMALFFSITTPVGIAIGIAIANTYDGTSPTGLIVRGVMDSFAAGILIYMALVDLLAQDFMNAKLQKNGRIFFGANITLCLGVGFMAVLAMWA
ncbi:hypothetical protein BVRB_9g221160 [Beta vulgaris subsp. vulgaris]|nr:hypothetical protein BVRB_9g221160 [Beta vulgaris subsp. vulgaris]